MEKIKMNDSKNRKIGAILSYATIILTTLIQLVYTPLLIRNLGKSEYGLFSIVNSIIGYLTVLDLGFGNAIIVYTAKYRAQKKYDEEKKLHGMFFIIFGIISVIAGILGFILYLNVDNFFGNTMTALELKKAKIMMLILTFNLVMSFLFSIYSSIINAYEKFIYQKIVALLNTVLKPIIMIPLLFMGFKSITMVVVITILNMLTLLSNYIYCREKLNIRIKYCGFDKVLFKVIFSYSIWIFLGTVVDKLNWSVDQFVLGAICGTAAVSLYSVASQINSIFMNLSGAISGVLLPKVSKMVAEKTSVSKLTDEFIKVGRIQFYIIFLIASGIVLFGKEFIIWWVGESYIESYYCLLFLALPLTIPLIQNLGISIRQAMNKHRFAAIVNIIVAILNLILSIFLAQKYGPVGSALGTGIGTLVSIMIINLYYNYNMKLDMKKFWKNIICLCSKYIIVIIAMILIMKIHKLSGIKNVIVYGGIYTTLYIFTTYLVCFNDYEKTLAKSILDKIRR